MYKLANKRILYLFIFSMFINSCGFATSTEDLIINFCGNEPKNSENFTITDQNIFPVDTNFKQVNLYDIEGNTVTTSSWIEGRHYVSGGWIYYIEGNKINLNKKSLFQLSGILWLILGPFMLLTYWRLVEKN